MATWKLAHGVKYKIGDWGNVIYKATTIKRYCEIERMKFDEPEPEYGTSEYMTWVLRNHDKRRELIAAECKPQEVYFREYNNHECNYAWDDSDAWDVCVDWFGESRCLKEIRRI